MPVRFGPASWMLLSTSLRTNHTINTYNLKSLWHINYLISGNLLKETILCNGYKFFSTYNVRLLLNKLDLKYINIYLIRTFFSLWGRVTFKGKGFRLKNYKKKKLTFNFGRSHWTKLLFKSYNLIFRKLKRQNYIFLFKSHYQYLFFIRTVRMIKPTNYYTKRGLRLKKQNIQRRFGKISQVVSSLH